MTSSPQWERFETFENTLRRVPGSNPGPFRGQQKVFGGGCTERKEPPSIGNYGIGRNERMKDGGDSNKNKRKTSELYCFTDSYNVPFLQNIFIFFCSVHVPDVSGYCSYSK